MNESEIENECRAQVANLEAMLRLGALGQVVLPQARAGDPKACELGRHIMVQLRRLGVERPLCRELMSGGEVK
ncbi:hypothetical protein [Nocardia sp. NPDC047654]|uniref:hypothetical protein n=1 Tax=Nocardia sp. NPDC047654 TaxID=3364314 RepID=UPI003719D125